jgi:hypothetical protein
MSPPDPPVHPIRFELHRFEDSAHELVPIIGSTSLVDLVKQFEEGAGFDPTGGYAGLVLDNYRFGDLGLYLAGQQQPWPGARVPLLGCECGEWGCWPLLATVTIADGVAEWSDFIDLNATTRGSAPAICRGGLPRRCRLSRIGVQKRLIHQSKAGGRRRNLERRVRPLALRQTSQVLRCQAAAAVW